jgi:acetyl esterase/lipase
VFQIKPEPEWSQSSALRVVARQKTGKRRNLARRLSIGLIVAAIALIPVCQYAAKEHKPPSAPTVIRNVVYDQGLCSYCVGDIYQPSLAPGALAPAVIVVHGGAWTTGTKGGPDTQPIVDRLVHEGFAVFDINYRLEAQGGTFPNNANDVKKAVEFIAQSAGIYHIDPQRVALLGISAGGQLALLAAYDPAVSHRCVNAAVAIAPVTNLVAIDNPMIAVDFPKNNPSRRLSASPVTYANSAVPTLLIHGADDRVIPIHSLSCSPMLSTSAISRLK